MNKSKMLIMTGLLFLAIFPLQLNAASNSSSPSKDSTKAIQLAEANVLLYRLKEIKTTDKSKMNSAEKKQLRKEARSLKKDYRENGNGNGGVYLSVGAIIIIILLLILLL